VLEKSLKLTAIKHKYGRIDSTREAFRYNLRMPGWETMGWKKSGFTIGRKRKVQYSMLRHIPWSISGSERYLLAGAMTLQTLLRHLGSTLSGFNTVCRLNEVWYISWRQFRFILKTHSFPNKHKTSRLQRIYDHNPNVGWSLSMATSTQLSCGEHGHCWKNVDSSA
jgi:hypothetical protein